MKKFVINTAQRLLIPFCACLLAFPRAVIAEEWRLAFDVTQEKQIGSPSGDSPPRNGVHSFALTVVLGSGYLVVDEQEANIEHKVDPPNGRRAQLQTALRRFSEIQPPAFPARLGSVWNAKAWLWVIRSTE